MADVRSYVIGVALADNLAPPAVDIQAVISFSMVFDGVNWDRLPGTTVDGALVNLGANNDVTVTGTVTVDTELAAAAALADNAANPTTPLIGACLLGFDGTTWDRLYAVADGDAVAAATKGLLAIGTDGTNYQVLKTDAAGELQVDVLTGGGVDTPTTPATDYVTSAALAAGSEVNLDTADIGTKKLWQVLVWASVPYRARIFKVENTVEATEPSAVGGGAQMGAWSWKPSHRNFMSITATAGTDAFRVEVTNLDAENAGDVYATFEYADN